VFPTEAVLIGDDHVPEIPLFDVVGKVGAALFWHKGVCCVNVGTTEGFTTMFIVAFAAHKPVVGVNVYVLVPGVVVLIGPDHVPVIPLLDVEDNIGAVAFWQSGEICVNCGVEELFTTTLIVAFDAHCPDVGVKVYVVIPAVDVLIGADHVPAIPLLDVVAKVGAVAF